MTDQEPAPIEWLRNAVEIYKRSIIELSAALNADDTSRDEAIAAIRTLVDWIDADSGERHGQFAAALNLANHDKNGGGRGIWSLSWFPTIRLPI